MSADGRRLRGDRSRERILRRGVEVAATHGVNGFSLSELASAAGVSKAGVAGLFGSKDALVLAVVERARTDIQQRVFTPVLDVQRGMARLRTLGSTWIDYLTDPDLVGGCFFAANMFAVDSLDGPLRDLFRSEVSIWTDAIAAMIADGIARGELSSANPDADAFALLSIGITTNTAVQLGVDGAADRARTAWTQHLDRLASNP